MQASDRIYFVDPVQPRINLSRIRDGLQLLVTEVPHHRKDGPVKPGDIVNLRNGLPYAKDGYMRVWYVGEDGNWYDGAVINQQHNSRYGLGLVGDLTIFGHMARRVDDNFALTDIRRSDGRQFSIREMSVDKVVPAAEWARDLFPKPDDPADVAEAKIAQAKVRWDQRIKHAFILREGIARNWMEHLSEHNFYEEHGLPKPVWDVLIDGDVTITDRSAQVEPVAAAQEALNRLPEDVRQRLDRVTQTTYRPSLSRRIAIPITAVVSARSTTTDLGEIRNMGHAPLVRRLRDGLGEYTLSFSSDTTLHPVLVSTTTAE